MRTLPLEIIVDVICLYLFAGQCEKRQETDSPVGRDTLVAVQNRLKEWKRQRRLSDETLCDDGQQKGRSLKRFARKTLMFEDKDQLMSLSVRDERGSRDNNTVSCLPSQHISVERVDHRNGCSQENFDPFWCPHASSQPPSISILDHGRHGE